MSSNSRGVVRRRRALLAGGVLVLAIALVQLVRPVPEYGVERVLTADLQLAGPPVSLPWPRTGQSAVSVVGLGEIGSSGGERPVPIASVTKVMTALLALEKHPLKPGEAGPALTVTAQDVARYRSATGTDESLVPVEAGQTVTLRHALEAVLVASANNVAPMLARWVAGTEDAFVERMNARAKALGLERTTYADPVGLDGRSVSTARDQVRLAIVAMRDPVFAEIVAMREADLPVVGKVRNYNALVGADGVVGVKTGSSRAAGGCLVFAVRRSVGGSDRLVVGAVLGQKDGPFLPIVLSRSRTLAMAAASSVDVRTAVPGGTRVARLVAPWGASAPVVVDADVRGVGWRGAPVASSLTVRRGRGGVPARRAVGSLEVWSGDVRSRVPLRTGETLRGPSLWWRLTGR